MPSTLSGTISYIKNFIRDPDVAAIVPSSSFLVRRVCKWIDFEDDCTVVEYGPGNGVFSEYILDRMTEDSTLILIETNEDFVDMLEEWSSDDDRVHVVQEQAQNVADILETLGAGSADYIVSGIPFSFLDEDVKEELLHETREVLSEDGKFLVYQNYNHLEGPLRRHFSEVTKEYEPRNIPPTMFAYEACK